MLSETRNDTESDDASDSESIMMSERDMENLNETEKFDEGLISTELLQDIRCCRGRFGVGDILLKGNSTRAELMRPPLPRSCLSW